MSPGLYNISFISFYNADLKKNDKLASVRFTASTNNAYKKNNVKKIWKHIAMLEFPLFFMNDVESDFPNKKVDS